MRPRLQQQLTGTPELTDAEIVRRVVGGERELFELLLRRHNQRLFRVARGAAASDAEAEDVLQDAWVRAFEHLDAFRGEAQFVTWLTRIALHEAFARRRRGRKFELLTPEAEARIETARPSPEREALTAELRRTLESAVGALPSSYRTVVVLREIEGLSTAETAAALELSEEAVKVRLHRARAALRRTLQTELGASARNLFAFDGARCDRVVAAVLARIAG